MSETQDLNTIGAPYVKILEKLREPIDYGGYDGFGPDQLHASAANAIGELIVGLISQVEISETLRQRIAELTDLLNQNIASKAKSDGVMTEQLRISRERIAELEAQLAEARMDTVRLDWAQEQSRHTSAAPWEKNKHPSYISLDINCERDVSLRAAIDVANGSQARA
jgi:hypothetical protein